MNTKIITCVAAAAAGLAMNLHADVDWMVLPKFSTSGRMLLHGTRDTTKGKRVAPGMRLETPKDNKLVKYSFLRIGSSSGFCFCGMNEKGLAIIFTGGDPTSDKNPPKTANTHTPNAATVIMLRSCATARQAVTHMQGAFKQKLISGSAIFFIADPMRAFVIECSPKHFASWELPHAFCVYANCWKLPGMDDGSLSPATRAANHYQREWAARESLRMAFDANKTISVADSLATSRVNVADGNGERFAKHRGKAKLTTAPFNPSSVLDSYLFDLDAEFPGDLSCVYVAWGPWRHTVYLPVPMGAADALPREMFAKEWLNNGYRLMDAAKPEDPVNPKLLEFENKQLAEFAKAREKAREMLRRDERVEAKKLLRATLKQQAQATLEFLKNLK